RNYAPDVGTVKSNTHDPDHVAMGSRTISERSIPTSMIGTTARHLGRWERSRTTRGAPLCRSWRPAGRAVTDGASSDSAAASGCQDPHCPAGGEAPPAPGAGVTGGQRALIDPDAG